MLGKKIAKKARKHKGSDDVPLNLMPGLTMKKVVNKMSKEELRRRQKQSEKDRAFNANRINVWKGDMFVRLGDDDLSARVKLYELPGVTQFMSGQDTVGLNSSNPAGKRCILDVKRLQVEFVNAGDSAVQLVCGIDGAVEVVLLPRDGKVFKSFPSFSSLGGVSYVDIQVQDHGSGPPKVWTSIKYTVSKHYQW